MIKFNVASINKCTEVEGPFKRLCIWFQGCNIHCEGCCNPDYQALIPKHLMSLDELMGIIQEAQNEFGIEGVTFSGGEPSLQQNLPILTSKIRVVISEDEKQSIRAFASNACDLNGFSSMSDLPLDSVFEENYELSLFAVHEAVYLLVLQNDFQLNGKIITRHNAELSAVDLLKSYRKVIS